ncbi:MAG: metallophosphoesterase [Clostridia bacterium]|nr:metallophosphoesterase [Clostridia bacterium]
MKTNCRKTFVRVICFALFLCLVLPFSSCKKGITPENKETTVYIATDIHLFSDTLVGEDNQVYLKDKFTSDGRIQEYDYELVKALVDKVNDSQPDFLVLTGDLSFNGEKDSHTELARLLGEVNDSTQVLVIPGNHDVYSLDAVSVLNDTIESIPGISADEFRKIYADFGYSGALSCDESSLSYIYELDDDKWALMLDTTQSKYNEQNGQGIVGGFLESETLRWLEEKLAYAKENNITVISFTHHNLTVHNELFKTSYTLGNYEQILALYAKYGVKLNFSGHLHIQSIKSEKIDGEQIYDICGGSLLDYGNRYGVLEIYENCYSYESFKLDVSTYAEDLEQYSFDVFCKKYYNKTLWSYLGSMGEEQGTKAVKLLSEINSYYFDGDYEKISALVKKNKKLVRQIKENTPYYETSYVKSIIEVEKKNQHKLIIER